MIKVAIHASVGSKGKNMEKDIKTVTALLNVYRRSLNQTSILMSAKTSAELESAIGEFQSNYLKSKSPDNKVDAGGKTFAALKLFYQTFFKAIALTPPTYGEVTWNSEGAEGGKYHSRCFTVPSTSSGLTVGRGYDMKEKSQAKIASDLTSIGLASTQVDTIKKAAGLSGGAAEYCVIENDLLDFQLTPAQQLALFKISYDEQAKEVERICGLDKNVKDYGKVDWVKLNSSIKDIAIDLKFRGDYTSASRKLIQKPIADNDLIEFKKQLKNSANWPNVPKDRFDRRVKFLDEH